MDSAARVRRQPTAPKTDPANLEIIRKKESLILSRTRVLHDLEASRNPRYRAMLQQALADLELQLSELLNKSARAASA
jgi:hypothetical protein